MACRCIHGKVTTSCWTGACLIRISLARLGKNSFNDSMTQLAANDLMTRLYR
jgi:hypothetical protein